MREVADNDGEADGDGEGVSELEIVFVAEEV